MPSVLLDVALRSATVYIVVLIGLRLLGKKHVAQLTTIDLVLILLISNAVQNAMVGNDTSLIGGIAAALTLLVLNYVLSLIFFRSRRAETLLEDEPTLLVHDGKAIRSHLDAEEITEEELERVIREHGIESVGKVKTAIMESDGTVSVIPRVGEERRIEAFRRHRLKFRQKKT